MTMHGGAPRCRRHATEGAVYVEYLAAAIPLFFMFLCMVQLAQLAMAGVAVRSAASTAVRSAIVVLPDGDRDRNGAGSNRQKSYGNVARWLAGGGAPAPMGASDPVLGFMQGASSGGFSGGGARGYAQPHPSFNGRAQNILAAAIGKTMAVSPPLDSAGDHAGLSIKNSFGDTSNDINDLAQRANYAQHATAVTVAAAGPGRPVTVNVFFQFRCAIPVADSIMCGQPLSFPAGSFSQGDVTRIFNLGGNFRMLRAVATLPAQPEIFIPGEVYP
ncbi:MAG: hypothetical protein R3A78_01765 [Polyangiales bacterium]